MGNSTVSLSKGAQLVVNSQFFLHSLRVDTNSSILIEESSGEIQWCKDPFYPTNTIKTEITLDAEQLNLKTLAKDSILDIGMEGLIVNWVGGSDNRDKMFQILGKINLVSEFTGREQDGYSLFTRDLFVSKDDSFNGLNMPLDWSSSVFSSIDGTDLTNMGFGGDVLKASGSSYGQYRIYLDGNIIKLEYIGRYDPVGVPEPSSLLPVASSFGLLLARRR